jgi:hypothetical protein
VVLPTSFGKIIPNLWFMILADTTLTRKSTAMDLVTDMLLETDPDLLLATDGSLEGMMTSLSARPGRPSLFLRDEFSGLLEAMTKKDYMAGFAETLTKLYDGKPMKRILRKEVVTVTKPVLILFAGGIKEKVCSLLTFEQVSSGFMPRFLFVTAESDPTRIRPLGPPTNVTDDGRERIMAEMDEITKHYHRIIHIPVPNVPGATTPAQMVFDAKLTPDAWQRYNQFEDIMVKDGLMAERPEIMTPVNDRMSKSTLKAAVLLAASRQRGPEVIVETIDIIRAISYCRSWKVYANEVMGGVGRGTVEKQIEALAGLVERRPGIGRSAVMRYMHLTAQTANALFETTEQRGYIVRQRQGRTEVLYPVTNGGRKK